MKRKIFSNNCMKEKMSPVNTGLLNGQLAWRQHDGRQMRPISNILFRGQVTCLGMKRKLIKIYYEKDTVYHSLFTIHFYFIGSKKHDVEWEILRRSSYLR